MLPEKHKTILLPELARKAESLPAVQASNVYSFAQDKEFADLIKADTSESETIAILNIFERFGNMDNFAPNTKNLDQSSNLPKAWLKRIYFAKQSVSIALLKKTDKKLLQSLISRLVSFAIESNGQKNDNLPLSLSIYDLIQQQYNLKINEVFLMFRMGINGNFGTIYGKLTVADVSKWLESFNLMLGDYATIVAQHQQQKYKNVDFAPNVKKTIAVIASQNSKLN